MLQIEDGWKPEVVSLINSEKDLVGETIFTLINPTIWEHASNNSKAWIDYQTNYCSIGPWNEFQLARINNTESTYTIEQAKHFIIFLRGFKKYLEILNKKESINQEFNF